MSANCRDHAAPNRRREPSLTGSFIRLLASLVLIPLLASCSAESDGATAAGSPSEAGTPSAASPASSDLALNSTFTSPLMHYSVAYPDGWTPTPATEPWEPGASNFWDDPVGDRIESADAGFRGTSQALAAGETAQNWLDAYLAEAPTDCGEREEVNVGGQTAIIDLNGCDGLGRLGGRVFDVVVVVGDHAYNFTMEGEVDRALLGAMLDTVSFDDAP